VGFPFDTGQVQQMHILPVGRGGLLFDQGIVSPAISQRRIQLRAIAVAGERTRLAHQPLDDVSIINPVLVLTTQAGQPLHQVLGMPDFDLVQTNARFDFFATQPRRQRIGVMVDANRAATPHAHPHTFQALQTSRRQRLQLSHLHTDFGRSPGIALLHHAQHERLVLRTPSKIPAAAQQQSLFHGCFEVSM
jgi:hypothetical protein